MGFALMGSNVTRGNLKNLLTDKPSPITTKLAQKSDADGIFALMGSNVTRGELKNLVTDRPSPITTKLAQTMVKMEKNSVTDKQSLAQTQGVPVHVNPVIMRDTMGDANLGMQMRVGMDDVSVVKKNKATKL